MESKLDLFLKEVTQELLYNILYSLNDEDSIEYRQLSQLFKAKYGRRPMDYFGLRIKSGSWKSFLKSSPGLCFIEKNVSILKDESGNKPIAYEKFNKTKMHLMDESFNITVAQYREIFLRNACELITKRHQHNHDASTFTDDHGNTLLHLIAALPCVEYEPTLVKHLLDAGFDPLQRNNDGQTILHIIAGKMEREAIRDEDGEVIGYGPFGNGKVDSKSREWPAKQRVALLQHLSQLPPRELTVLANTTNNNGNTAMHEWVISVSTITSCCLQLGFEEEEKEIGLKLLSFGANLRQPNNLGEIPLHFAYNADLFQFLLEKSEQTTAACCRARNGRDETPFLRMLKYAVNLAPEFAAEEMSITPMLLHQLLDLVTNNKDVCETAWLPDADGNSAVDIILRYIWKASYTSTKPPKIFWGDSFLNIFGKNPGENVNEGKLSNLRKILVKLLSECLRVSNGHDLKRRNLLHTLLDLGDKSKFINDEELLEAVEILLKHHAEVNAVDSKGRTPLDVIKENESKNSKLASFFTKCENTLSKYGARRGASMRSSAYQKTLSTSTDSKVRKLLPGDCPDKHKSSAKQLLGNSRKVTVVKEIYRYSSEDPIGCGAFSSIFVAIKDEYEDGKSGITNCRTYALKRMEKAKMPQREIKREIETLLSMPDKCENIIKCHETFHDDFFQYLCLELMDGDLNDFFTNKKANSDLKANPVVAVQGIINGLVYLHEHNFIHRDLKPGNILYRTNPNLHFKIGDFGLTKSIGSFSTMTSTIGSGVAMAPGTRCWMAPELVSMKSREHTKKSDLFSLGLVLHYLLTLGKHPFASSSEEPPYAIETKVTNMQINIDPGLHPEASNCLQCLMARDPEKRVPAKDINQHPFLWSERKKIEFLKAVGDQPEAVNPSNHSSSALEQRLQATTVGKRVELSPWDRDINVKKLLREMVEAWKQKKYRTDKVIDLMRFIRNAYNHKQERSSELQDVLDRNIFLRVYPTLVLDVFFVVQDLGFLETRRNIRQALTDVDNPNLATSPK